MNRGTGALLYIGTYIDKSEGRVSRTEEGTLGKNEAQQDERNLKSNKEEKKGGCWVDIYAGREVPVHKVGVG